MWAKGRLVQSLGGGWLERFGLTLWSKIQLPTLRARKDKAVVELLTEVLRSQRTLLSAYEQYFVYSVARAQALREGAMAEVGVFRGGSARLICEAKGGKPLHLFDTFEGLPDRTDADSPHYQDHHYRCGLSDVQAYLQKYENVHFHPGLFPDSAHDVPEQSYCFAHFDVDLYESTKSCLEYFYPRMIPGGLMVSHDYGFVPGVEKAYQEFFRDKPEGIIDLPTTQCLVVKLCLICCLWLLGSVNL